MQIQAGSLLSFRLRGLEARANILLEQFRASEALPVAVTVTCINVCSPLGWATTPERIVKLISESS